MNSSHPIRNSIIYMLLMAAVAFFFITTLNRNGESVPVMDIGTVAQKALAGEVKRITVDDQDLIVELTDGRQARARKEADGSVVETLRKDRKSVV